MSNNSIGKALNNAHNKLKFTDVGKGYVPDPVNNDLKYAPSLSGNILPVGTILMFSTSSAPEGYFNCDGAEISRTTYSRLFSVIGTTFGVGNGSTTFNLPSMNDKFPMGAFTFSVGATGGSTGTENGFATINDGGHSHGIDVNVSDGGSGGGYNIPTTTTQSQITGITDSGHNHAFAPPYLVINFIIKYQ